MQSKTIAILNDTTSHFNYCSSLISFEFENDERVLETSFIIAVFLFLIVTNCLFKAPVISRALLSTWVWLLKTELNKNL